MLNQEAVMAKKSTEEGSLFDPSAAKLETPGTGLPFEQAFARLEQILERLNTDAVPLDEALRLYEEANRLLMLCGNRLNEAEARIEVLSKTRSGELVMGADGRPLTQDLPSS
jgi:exodeoxyribonuclease VII small subunit